MHPPKIKEFLEYNVVVGTSNGFRCGTYTLSWYGTRPQLSPRVRWWYHESFGVCSTFEIVKSSLNETPVTIISESGHRILLHVCEQNPVSEVHVLKSHQQDYTFFFQMHVVSFLINSSPRVD